MPNFDTFLFNKQNWTYHIKAFEYPFNGFWVVEIHKLAAFYLCRYIDSFSPWEDIVRKKVSKLRSIAELRAFDGMFIIGQGLPTEKLEIMNIFSIQ